jgi:hypothetical protein
VGVVEPVQVSPVHAFAEFACPRESVSQTVVCCAVGDTDLIRAMHARPSLQPLLCCLTLVCGFPRASAAASSEITRLAYMSAVTVTISAGGFSWAGGTVAVSFGTADCSLGSSCSPEWTPMMKVRLVQ